MNDYIIRFNTKQTGDGFVWRVFENGKEHLATDLRIETPAWSTTTLENGETKWNIACQGYAKWQDGAVVISGEA